MCGNTTRGSDSWRGSAPARQGSAQAPGLAADSADEILTVSDLIGAGLRLPAMNCRPTRMPPRTRRR
jgi:hypothetical protein